MPVLHRTNEPTSYYDIDDYTIPGRTGRTSCSTRLTGVRRISGTLGPYLARFYKVVRPICAARDSPRKTSISHKASIRRRI